MIIHHAVGRAFVVSTIPGPKGVVTIHTQGEGGGASTHDPLPQPYAPSMHSAPHCPLQSVFLALRGASSSSHV